MVSFEKVRPYLATVDYPADRDAMPPEVYRNSSEVVSSAGTDVAPELSARDKARQQRDRKHQRVAEPLRTFTPGTRERTSGPSK